jgi:ribosomal protein S27E
MEPLDVKRGHYYYAIKCPKCETKLPLIEVPPYSQMEEYRERLRDLIVRCGSCTQETQVRDQQVIFLEGR